MSDLYFRQLLAGRDFARGDAAAAGMLNFAYLVGSRSRRECVVVDPAWDVDGIAAIARADDMRLVGALATHYHPDHVGGDLFGHDVEGVARFVALAGAKVWANENEGEWIRRTTGVGGSDLVLVPSGHELALGEVRITFLHTPGHTPGSQCFLVDGRNLVAGDTLFLSGCGRTDLPGGDPAELYFSLTQRLAKLPDDVVLYPGHRYDPQASAPLREVRASNPFLNVPSLERWLARMG